ncbi:MAG TPA: SprT-like domain-containing protein [Acidobacteriota bacterium]|nr:SprT-like domain-containing protein [Acidobacteriota bacterium]
MTAMRPGPDSRQPWLDFMYDLDLLFDQLNRRYWQGVLPRYRCEWSARMLTTWGCCYPDHRVIRISILFQSRPLQELEAIMKHEMIHIRIRGHGPTFRHELKRVGLPRDVEGHFPFLNELTRGRRRALRHTYMCPHCQVRIHRRRRIRGYCVNCYEKGVVSWFKLVRGNSDCPTSTPQNQNQE